MWLANNRRGTSHGCRNARSSTYLLEEIMNTVLRELGIAFTSATLIVGLLAASPTFAGNMKVKLTGEEEVPPVQTQASGSGTITVNEDKSVSGSVITKGIKQRRRIFMKHRSARTARLPFPSRRGLITSLRFPLARS